MKGMIMRHITLAALLAAGGLASAHAGVPHPANVLPMTVQHSDTFPRVNIPMVSITLCAPGHTDAAYCQTIPNILVDTGAAGLRIVSSVLKPGLRKTLVPETHQGKPVAECLQYVSSAVWGKVSKADVWLGTDPTQGKTLNPQYGKSVPFQVIGDDDIPAAPKDCASTGPVMDSVEDFGANGTIGVQPSILDGNPLYYTCNAATCEEASVGKELMVPNPVSLLPSDNNGVILQLDPLHADNKQETVSGKLILGIGTEDNNKLAPNTRIAYVTPDEMGMSSIKLQVGANEASTFVGKDYYDAFDSGTNALRFPSLQGLSTVYPHKWWYNPPKSEVVSMTFTDTKGTATSSSFTVAPTVPADFTKYAVLSQLGGHDKKNVLIGLPYFYGKTLYFAMDGAKVPAADGKSVLTGPFNGL
ncbi:DUF3443 family protein [Chromobacterium vaccinii]|uniref:DUF3443 family protein n=1 Tax=Chromobacterium vaccinii TaxID=1108595 RepID=UPI003C70B74C